MSHDPRKRPLAIVRAGLIWKGRLPAREPELVLVHWKIVQTDTGRRHFVGSALNNGKSRVSSAIRKFDARTARGVTRSGRIYRLEGPPGESRAAAYVWTRWALINKVHRAVDVSDVVWAEILEFTRYLEASSGFTARHDAATAAAGKTVEPLEGPPPARLRG